MGRAEDVENKDVLTREHLPGLVEQGEAALHFTSSRVWKGAAGAWVALLWCPPGPMTAVWQVLALPRGLLGIFYCFSCYC